MKKKKNQSGVRYLATHTLSSRIKEPTTEYAEITVDFIANTAKFHYPFGNPNMLKEQTLDSSKVNIFIGVVIIMASVLLIEGLIGENLVPKLNTDFKPDFTPIDLIPLGSAVAGVTCLCIAKRQKKKEASVGDIKFGAYVCRPWWKKKEITQIQGLTYTIEHFDNLMLDYELVGDFKKFIRKIEIKLKDYKRNKWYANFYFTQHPKAGAMRLIYC